MTNFILKQFKEGRKKTFFTEYQKFMGYKSPNTLNSIFSGISDNLLTSTEAFVDAVIDCDEEFIKSTSTHLLHSKILNDIHEITRKNVKIQTERK